MAAELLTEEGTALVAGLHHVTFTCCDARAHDVFWTKILGLRRVKLTVDCDCPDSFHLYYANETGKAGTLISALFLPRDLAETPARSFAPAAKAEAPRRAGQHITVFSVRAGALPFWQKRLSDFGIASYQKKRFGQAHLCFRGPCGEYLELAENAGEKRPACTQTIAADKAICGLYSLFLAVRDKQAATDFLILLGYRQTGQENGISRFALPQGSGANNGAAILDVEQGVPPPAKLPAEPENLKPGAVAHFAFSVPESGDLAQLREFLLDKGYQIGGLKDNVYYTYFFLHTPQGPVVEMAGAEPDFTKDERLPQLGASLQLPKELEHLRQFILSRLELLP